ncbi:MAG: ABC transporter ATP-binding protein [Bacilli bacterium]|uniref:ABC transporter ATP-binding protein n=1 Tax=Cetobacterium sp. TaxID=2071632 RepID=UPI002FC64DD5
MEVICKLNNIVKTYGNRKILNDFNLEINKGELVAIKGKSGVGKTTLLNIMGLIEKIDNGKIILFGEDVTKITNNQLNKLLRNKISYLFQNYALIDSESIDKNLDIALTYSKQNKKEKKILKENALKKVGLNISTKSKIYELSGGEQQRVAIARIMVKPSDIILADEPTGSLDSNTKHEIIQLLKTMNAEGKTIIIVTHDDEVSDYCDRIIEL